MAMSGTPWARVKEAFTGRAIPRALLKARITHARLAPKPYSLAHNLTYIYAPVRALDALPRPLLSRNGFNLFALNDRDYGTKGAPEPLARWIARAFESAGRTLPDGDIHLLTLPRVLGFGFNPVSFWLCHDKSRFSARHAGGSEQHLWRASLLSLHEARRFALDCRRRDRGRKDLPRLALHARRWHLPLPHKRDGRSPRRASRSLPRGAPRFHIRHRRQAFTADVVGAFEKLPRPSLPFATGDRAHPLSRSPPLHARPSHLLEARAPIRSHHNLIGRGSGLPTTPSLTTEPT